MSDNILGPEVNMEKGWPLFYRLISTRSTLCAKRKSQIAFNTSQLLWPDSRFTLHYSFNSTLILSTTSLLCWKTMKYVDFNRFFPWKCWEKCCNSAMNRRTGLLVALVPFPFRLSVHSRARKSSPPSLFPISYSVPGFPSFSKPSLLLLFLSLSHLVVLVRGSCSETKRNRPPWWQSIEDEKLLVKWPTVLDSWPGAHQ